MKTIIQTFSPLLTFVGVVALGFLVAQFVSFEPVIQGSFYSIILNLLLAIGFYASVHGIDLVEFKNQRNLILRVVTIGVLIKAFIIGGILFLFTGEPISFILGVVVAQIDPLSISNLLSQGVSRVSAKAKTIILSWASFDDPITVLLVFSFTVFIFQTTSSGFEQVAFLLANIILPVIAYGLVRISNGRQQIQWIALALVFVLSVYYSLMLAVAISALFLRPQFPFDLSRVTEAAYLVALFILGVFPLGVINIKLGLVLAISAVLSQIFVTYVLARNLDRKDQRYIMFAQQNGLTAVVLALYFEQFMPGAIGIVATAIFIINFIHIVSFMILDRKY